MATLFGVASSLGPGAIQLNAGLSNLFGLPVSWIVQLAAAAAADVSRGLFLMLEQLPPWWLLGATACVALVTFFVTSSTSGAFVVDIVTAGGDPDPPRTQRLFWPVMTGVAAGTLLLGGGLTAPPTAAILAGLPFSLVLLLLCAGIWRAVSVEAASGRHPGDAGARGD